MKRALAKSKNNKTKTEGDTKGIIRKFQCNKENGGIDECEEQ